MPCIEELLPRAGMCGGRKLFGSLVTSLRRCGLACYWSISQLQYKIIASLEGSGTVLQTVEEMSRLGHKYEVATRSDK